MLDVHAALSPLDLTATFLLPSLIAETIPGDSLPEPYRSLLVHRQDMTSTLERFHGEMMCLRVLEKRLEGSVLHRRVVLAGVDSDKPVEFGAIRIHLENLDSQACSEVLDGTRPLGAILAKYSVPYLSRPSTFLRLPCQSSICQALDADLGTLLYGRHNILSRESGATLAEVVEILPPSERPIEMSVEAPGGGRDAG